jgi:hypothetical protein
LNHSISGLELASLRLNEPEAKIQVYAAWRKGEDSPAVLGFLDSVRATFPSPVDKRSIDLRRTQLKMEVGRTKSLPQRV